MLSLFTRSASGIDSGSPESHASPAFKTNAKPYRGRLAPSPTGMLHVGHARTFWTAYQRARDSGGALAMRMDDLDPERSRNEYAEAALEDLRWLGIRWQEGPPGNNGAYGPYV